MLTKTLPKFVIQAAECGTLEALQAKILTMFNDIVKAAWTDHKFLLKPLQEPQSEAEESKEETDFAKSIFEECTKFIEALRKYEFTQEQKIGSCTGYRNMQ